jgi:lysophospholipase L1-like esterase
MHHLNMSRRAALAGGLASWLATSASTAAAVRRGWLTAWASAQQVPEAHNAMPAGEFADATLRQIVRLAAGGAQLRVRISNLWGTEPLRIGAAAVAAAVSPGSSAVRAGSHRALAFRGQSSVTIPAGAEYLSDAVAMPTRAFEDLAISLHIAAEPARQTSHPGSRATSYLVKGQRVAADELAGAKTANHWWFLSGVETLGSPQAQALAVIGDSITDGYGVQPNTNSRWTDFLARRLQGNPATRHISVLNLGLGGNRLLTDGLGPNAAARFERDVLGQAGVRQAIVLEGVNDLGGGLTHHGVAGSPAGEALVEGMLGAYSQMVAKARARGVRIIGGTILPFGASKTYKPDAATEAARQRVNAWIRTPGRFDAVIDFDAMLRDPADPRLLAARWDNDGLHPSIAGYQAMAEGVPLEVLTAR